MILRACLVLSVAVFALAQPASAVLRPIPGVALTAGSTELVEGGAEGEFNLALKLKPSADVLITVGESEQCSFSQSQVIFTPDNWAEAQSIVVTAFDDNVAEGAHSCAPGALSISGADEYIWIELEPPQFSISDNDKAELTISTLSNGDESGPQDVNLRVSLSKPSVEPTRVELSYDGTATGGGVDYTGPSEVTIPAGETAVEVDLAVVEDDVPEGIETVLVSAQSSNSETEIVVGKAASQIADERAPVSPLVAEGFATQASQFMKKRLGFVASHGPVAQRLLNRENGKSVSVALNGTSIAGVTVSPVADIPNSQSDWNMWMEGEFGQGASDDQFFVGYMGADYLVNDKVALGLMVEGDVTEAEGVSGKGFMVGPYLSAEIADNIFLDLRGLWGASNNRAALNILGDDYTGTFSSDRWMLEARLAGIYDVNDFRITPEAIAVYGSDKSTDFDVSDGVNVVSVAGQSVDLAQVSAGVNITYLGALNEAAFEPFVGAKVNWNLENSAARGAVSLGFNVRSETDVVSASATYDGIGEFASVSGKLSFSHQF